MSTTSALAITSIEDADIPEVIRLWKRAGLVRNIALVLGNLGNAVALPALERRRVRGLR